MCFMFYLNVQKKLISVFRNNKVLSEFKKKFHLRNFVSNGVFYGCLLRIEFKYRTNKQRQNESLKIPR